MSMKGFCAKVLTILISEGDLDQFPCILLENAIRGNELKLSLQIYRKINNKVYNEAFF